MAATGSSQAYIIFSSTSRDVQERAGFDGWVLLVRDYFDTEDQAWPHERLRLEGIARKKLRKLERAGVELDTLHLHFAASLLFDPPPEDREEEHIWCIEYFTMKMYDFVDDDRMLVERISRFQDELKASAKGVLMPPLPTTSAPFVWAPADFALEHANGHSTDRSIAGDGARLSARPSGCAVVELDAKAPSPPLDPRSAGRSKLAERSAERALDLSRLRADLPQAPPAEALAVDPGAQGRPLAPAPEPGAE